MTRAPDVALFVPSLYGGGAENVMVNLAAGLVARGLEVDVVAVRAEGAYLADVPSRACLIDLKARGVLRSLPALVRYLRHNRPRMLVSTLNSANCVAIVAKRLAGVSTHAVVRQSNTLSRTLADGAGGLRQRTARWLTAGLVLRLYRQADGIIAVSDGVALDLARALSVPLSRIHVAPNPIVTPELLRQARAPLDHPWFPPGAPTAPPVVLGAGRLTRQKDFATLLRAVADVRRERPCRLVILGEGPERPALEALAAHLGIADAVELPGFVRNPFAYMARAAVFVLSSAWEGLPGVLIQALACGTPVIATDCDSGPAEILAGGRFGRLVPVGDVAALARAVALELSAPKLAPSREAWAPFTQDVAVEQYLRVMRGEAA